MLVSKKDGKTKSTLIVFRFNNPIGVGKLMAGKELMRETIIYYFNY